MFSLSTRAGSLLALTLALSVNAHADKIEMGFMDVGNRVVHVVAPSGDVAVACAAFEKVYAVENGYRGCTHGVNDSMVVMVNRRLYGDRIWNKMVARGDAGYENGIAYFYFNQTGYKDNYQFFGKMTLDEGRNTSGSYSVQGNRSQFIVGYMVSMHEACTVTNSGITKAKKTAKIKPTKLERTTRKGSSIQYHYSVNEGQGTDILGITVQIAPGRWPLYDICEVNIYADYGDAQDDEDPIVE